MLATQLQTVRDPTFLLRLVRSRQQDLGWLARQASGGGTAHPRSDLVADCLGQIAWVRKLNFVCLIEASCTSFGDAVAVGAKIKGEKQNALGPSSVVYRQLEFGSLAEANRSNLFLLDSQKRLNLSERELFRAWSRQRVLSVRSSSKLA